MPYYTPTMLPFRTILLIARMDLARSQGSESWLRLYAVYPKVSVEMLHGRSIFKALAREVRLASGDLFEASPLSAAIKIK